MVEEPYTNADLDTAETLLIGAGRPELAQAMRRHAEGVRNLVQGEWGQQSVAAMEGILERLTDRLTDRLKETDTARAAEAAQILTEQKRAGELLGGVQERMGALYGLFSTLAETVSDHAAQLTTHTEQIAQIERRLDAHDQRLSTLEREVSDLRRDIAADRGRLRGIRG